MKLILLGPPAAGKGTQAECIAERYSLAHISTGDMLRAEISKKTPLGLRAKALIDDGNLVPDEIINEMVLSRIQHEDCSIGFLLDGYPRTIAQAETLAVAVNIDAVIDINVDSDILIERVLTARLPEMQSLPVCQRGRYCRRQTGIVCKVRSRTYQTAG